MEKDLRVVLCTFPDWDQARQIGAALVEAQVAACVNLLPGAESIYRWQGKVETANEVVGIIKTANYPALEEMLTRLHPYDVPEIVALEIKTGLREYLNWLGEPS